MTISLCTCFVFSHLLSRKVMRAELKLTQRQRPPQFVKSVAEARCKQFFYIRQSYIYACTTVLVAAEDDHGKEDSLIIMYALPTLRTKKVCKTRRNCFLSSWLFLSSSFLLNKLPKRAMYTESKKNTSPNFYIDGHCYF